MSAEASWAANFRDLGASLTRMATLAPSGRITEDIVAEEVERLGAKWTQRAQGPAADDEALLAALLGAERLAAIDLFDRVQLATVIRVCRDSRSLSEAGRRLFAASRQAKTSTNDADRLKKYLARFSLSWSDLTDAG